MQVPCPNVPTYARDAIINPWSPHSQVGLIQCLGSSYYQLLQFPDSYVNDDLLRPYHCFIPGRQRK